MKLSRKIVQLHPIYILWSRICGGGDEARDGIKWAVHIFQTFSPSQKLKHPRGTEKNGQKARDRARRSTPAVVAILAADSTLKHPRGTEKDGQNSQDRARRAARISSVVGTPARRGRKFRAR
jgi:hypothetical protein